MNKINKNAQGKGIWVLIFLILAALVLVFAAIAIGGSNLPNKIKDLFPEFKKGNQTIQEFDEINKQQQGVALKEKSLDCPSEFKIIKLLYTSWDNDLFELRYNRNLDRPQINIMLDEDSELASDEWLIYADSLKSFREGSDINDKGAEAIRYLMRARDEESFALRLSEKSLEEGWEIQINGEFKESLTNKEILDEIKNPKNELKYKEEIKTAKEICK